jgi:hypothetical protein
MDKKFHSRDDIAQAMRKINSMCYLDICHSVIAMYLVVLECTYHIIQKPERVGLSHYSSIISFPILNIDNCRFCGIIFQEIDIYFSKKHGKQKPLHTQKPSH